MNKSYYFDSMEFITENIIKECPICISKYFSEKINIINQIITDDGPHYRYLVDITYLKDEIFINNTKYRYILFMSINLSSNSLVYIVISYI